MALQCKTCFRTLLLNLQSPKKVGGLNPFHMVRFHLQSAQNKEVVMLMKDFIFRCESFCSELTVASVRTLCPPPPLRVCRVLKQRKRGRRPDEASRVVEFQSERFPNFSPIDFLGQPSGQAGALLTVGFRSLGGSPPLARLVLDIVPVVLRSGGTAASGNRVDATFLMFSWWASTFLIVVGRVRISRNDS